MAQMRRQSLVKFDAPLCETIVETPKPQGREVLVRVERCGLCHSDLHIQDGYADLGGGKRLDTTRGMTLPFTLGHEIAGIVDEVGGEVAQDLIGKHHFRPREAKAQAKYASAFKAIPMVTIDQAFGGWAKASAVHFAEGGLFDQIYKPT